MAPTSRDCALAAERIDDCEGVTRVRKPMCWLAVAEYESRRSAQLDTECAPEPGESRSPR
jgi:hypothetical protein